MNYRPNHSQVNEREGQGRMKSATIAGALRVNGYEKAKDA